ncbi:MAG: CBS domain-containing protein [Myxococcaceae bacterium]
MGMEMKQAAVTGDLTPRQHADAQRTTVFQIMSRDVICLTPDMTVETLRETLLQNGISGAPVVDEAGKPVGIITTIDVVRDQHERGDTFETGEVRLPTKGGVSYSPGPGFHLLDPGSTVGEVMSRKVVTIRDNVSIAKAAELMAKNHVHRLPVVSEAGTVVGLVSSLDILGWLAGLS